MESRRQFFRNLILAIGAGTFAQFFMRDLSFAQGKPELLDMTGKKRTDAANKACMGPAKSINYHDKAADMVKAVKSQKIKFTPPSFKDKSGKEIPLDARTCAKCALFALTDPKLNSCALISGCLVAPEGACTSWSPKPGAV